MWFMVLDKGMECCVTHIIGAEEIKSLSWMLADHILVLAESKMKIFENKYSKLSGLLFQHIAEMITLLKPHITNSDIAYQQL